MTTVVVRDLKNGSWSHPSAIVAAAAVAPSSVLRVGDEFLGLAASAVENVPRQNDSIENMLSRSKVNKQKFQRRRPQNHPSFDIQQS
jgi:hypothetical protein